MVPVLSSSSVFTSPAASTALPLMASTLCCITRSMPAMPMAESSPPIVVGIRHTSSETSTVTVGASPVPLALTLKIANGCRLTTASKNTSVRPAITILRAISLGVFCRSAPSTRAIIRSRNVSPGFEVIFTLIQSLSTFVPPVTALRSPPDSRITGALSPVIADSSTLAMPSMTSPSPGMISSASTRTMSPARSWVAGTISKRAPVIRRAVVSVLVLRSVSACALPRPSAMASAKFANSTVNHSHSVICSVNPARAAPVAKSRSARIVVISAPTSTTNMTGFFIMVRGLSFAKESRMARFTIGGSNSGRARAPFFGTIEAGSTGADAPTATGILAPQPSLVHQEVLHNRSQRQRREERERSNDHHHSHQQGHKQRTVGGECAGRDRHQFLLRQTARRRQQRNDHQEAAPQHGEPQRGVQVRRIGAQTGKRASVVTGGARIGVQDLRETVRPVVGHAVLHGFQSGSYSGEAKDR